MLLFFVNSKCYGTVEVQGLSICSYWRTDVGWLNGTKCQTLSKLML